MIHEDEVEKVAKEMLEKHKEVFENLAAYDRGEKEYPHDPSFTS